MARALSALGPPPTDRAHLLLDPREGDACDAFSSEVLRSLCDGDGHYLCASCARFAPSSPPEEALCSS